ncbi:4-hydroxy-2-oxovalerate aldolase [Rhodobacteraceae bacterium KLH11]|nr:4-hydroxy-2-oxovalerate aldolase [Rhodobacteraceae bacterium KLH11]
MADPYAAEIASTASFDWLLIDGEHAPNDLRSILAQLQIVQASDAHAAVRLPVGETWMIKQVLDAGAQTILIPMVESGEQARELVRAVTYPPHGVRGVGAALARASGFSAIPDYMQTADEQICLMAQVENRAGLEALDDILAVDGIDCVFIGPADLAADLGHPGQLDHPEVDGVIMDTLSRIVQAGKVAGILTLDPQMQKRYAEAGVTFMATAIDVLVFADAMRRSSDETRALLAS